jgi:hypothetical protein
MSESRQLRRFTVLGLTIAGLWGSSIFAQEQPKSETAMTGCLTKGSAGTYTLTDEKTGVKITVTGPADLEKHSANHKVTLTGAAKTDASGNQVLEVSKIQHVSASCKAPEK